MFEHYENKNCYKCKYRENTFCHEHDVHLTNDNKVVIDKCAYKNINSAGLSVTIHHNEECQSCPQRSENNFCKLLGITLTNKFQVFIDNCSKIWGNRFWAVMGMLRDFSHSPMTAEALSAWVLDFKDKDLSERLKLLKKMDIDEVIEKATLTLVNIVEDEIADMAGDEKERIKKFMIATR